MAVSWSNHPLPLGGRAENFVDYDSLQNQSLLHLFLFRIYRYAFKHCKYVFSILEASGETCKLNLSYSCCFYVV